MTRRIILNRQIVEDCWQYLDDQEALPDAGDYIVTLERWRNQRDELSSHKGRIAILLHEHSNIEDLGEDLRSIPLIVLQFPIINTNKRGYHPVGNGYTQAYLLRTRFQYPGELRATGEAVMRDVLYYMERCGINSFVLPANKDINDALKAFNEMTVVYQPSADETVPAFIRRRSAA